jgi:hypothetical protein
MFRSVHFTHTYSVKFVSRAYTVERGRKRKRKKEEEGADHVFMLAAIFGIKGPGYTWLK